MNYSYQGLFQGKQTTGSIEASDKNAAMALLQGQNIIVTLLKTKKAAAESGIQTFMGIQLGSDKIKDEDLLAFTRKLQTMLKSNLPIMEALSISRKQAKTPGLIKLTRSLIEDLNNGLAFSEGLKKFPKVFDDSYVNMVRAGESSGTLAKFLAKICELMDKKAKIIKDIKGALSYPIILLSVALGVTGVMLVKVVPVFQEIYGSMGVGLPGSTQTIVGISEFLRDPGRGGILMLLIITIYTSLHFLIKRNYRAKKTFHRLTLRIPVFGALIIKSIYAKLSLVLANLLSSGVSIIEALEISSRVTNNLLVRESLTRIQKEVLTGKNLSELFLSETIFPIEFSEFMRVGEKTGTVDDMFASIAIFYEAEVDEQVNKLKQFIEPVMIVLIGLLIGILLLALYQPIFSMGTVVK